MGTSPVNNVQSEANRIAFGKKCSEDVNFLMNAMSAVMINEKAKIIFMAFLEQRRQHAEYGMECGFGYPNIPVDGSATRYTYRTPSVAQQLSNLNIKPNPGPMPTGQLTLLSYNGSEWGGLLKEVAPYLKYFGPGVITSCLIQTLFGSDAGLIILPALLINLL